MKRIAKKHHVGNGRMMTVKEIADKVGLTLTTAKTRVKNWPPEDVLRNKMNYGHTLNNPTKKEYDVGGGRKMTLNEIAEIVGIPASAARYRVAHWPAERLLNKKVLATDPRTSNVRKREDTKLDCGEDRMMTVKEIMEITGLTRAGVQARYASTGGGSDMLAMKTGEKTGWRGVGLKELIKRQKENPENTEFQGIDLRGYGYL